MYAARVKKSTHVSRVPTLPARLVAYLWAAGAIVASEHRLTHVTSICTHPGFMSVCLQRTRSYPQEKKKKEVLAPLPFCTSVHFSGGDQICEEVRRGVRRGTLFPILKLGLLSANPLCANVCPYFFVKKLS